MEKQTLKTLAGESPQHEEQASTATKLLRAQTRQNTSAPRDIIIPLFSKFALINQNLQIF